MPDVGVLQPIPLKIPAVAEDDAEHVGARCHQLCYIKGFIINRGGHSRDVGLRDGGLFPLIIIGLIGCEHVIADLLAIERSFIIAQSGDIQTGLNQAVGEGEVFAKQGRGGFSCRGRVGCADPLRLPVAAVQQSHLPRGRGTPGAGTILLIPDHHFPESRLP
ncbi:MAG: hypothetical protein BWY83_02937 [bacterium ADurb.Bin478]|nr:MAG: hypothetical protein BWY83_02937 [bacterium ADurb.Bin478]